MKSRAYRRYQIERLKKKRKHYWAYPYRYPDHVEEMSDRKLGMVANTPAPCSCWGCGNPRRHFKSKDRLTVQEQRFNMMCSSEEE